MKYPESTLKPLSPMALPGFAGGYLRWCKGNNSAVVGKGPEKGIIRIMSPDLQYYVPRFTIPLKIGFSFHASGLPPGLSRLIMTSGALSGSLRTRIRTLSLSLLTFFRKAAYFRKKKLIISNMRKPTKRLFKSKIQNQEAARKGGFTKIKLDHECCGISFISSLQLTAAAYLRSISRDGECR